MKIEFVNHASFIIDVEKIRLICDPWIDGTAFDNGWALLSKSKFQYHDFSSITHIWFSHEHPDHFSPPNLLKIPVEIRKNIEILFQKTTDKKVVNFCRKIGFKNVVELEKNKLFTLTSNLKLLNNPYTEGDSYLLIKYKELKILNLNDCIVNSEKKAKELSKCVGNVDVLFTQFGYANKVGNKDEEFKRINASKEKLERIKIQSKYLEPKYIVPFASFIYFCHSENEYMNSGMNEIGRVYDYIKSEIKAEPIVLYPGDIWEVEKTYKKNREAIEKYQEDYSLISDHTYLSSNSVPVLELINSSKLFIERLHKKNGKAQSKIRLFTAKIYLSDYNQSFILSGDNGLLETIEDFKKSADIILSSQALNYAFMHEWGGDTLSVNARYQTTNDGNISKFRIFTKISAMNNRGESYREPNFISNLFLKLKRIYSRLLS